MGFFKEHYQVQYNQKQKIECNVMHEKQLTRNWRVICKRYCKTQSNEEADDRIHV